MTDIEARLAALEDRVRLLEDHNAIMRLLCTYGPAVDSGSAETVAQLWTEDGVYDVDTGRMDGREQIAAMVRSDSHQKWINGGCGHVISPAHLTVTGDTAVATCHTQMILKRHGKDGYTVGRVTANRWELARTSDGWKVTTRTNRLLNGSPEARELLARGVH